MISRVSSLILSISHTDRHLIMKDLVKNVLFRILIIHIICNSRRDIPYAVLNLAVRNFTEWNSGMQTFKVKI